MQKKTKKKTSHSILDNEIFNALEVMEEKRDADSASSAKPFTWTPSDMQQLKDEIGLDLDRAKKSIHEVNYNFAN